MRSKTRAASVLMSLLALALLGAACGGGGGSAKGASLTGAGATFPEPIYQKWFRDFQKVQPGAKVNYQAIGSGGGIQQFTSGTVDFGATDAPLKDEEQAVLRSPALEIPTVLGGVVLAYHVSGVQSGLKLDGKTAADIFLHKVTKWNDPSITAQNPGVNLPPTPIQVAHRSDESGTTFVFTSWLASQSDEWDTKVGADKAVQWPVGTGGDGNDGVAAAISQTDGSIGYLSFDFAVSSGLGIADIKRHDGTYVRPSVQSISAAGGGLSFPISSDTNILNSPAAGAYPIASTTYLLVYQDLGTLKEQAKAQTLVDLLHWALTTGQQEVESLNYAPLPDDVRTKALEQLTPINFNGKVLRASGPVSG
jgi:phosphate transport system substrate-binding protein